jgi:protease-4
MSTPTEDAPRIPASPVRTGRESRAQSPVGWVILSLLLGIGLGGTCSTCLTGAAVQGDEVIAGGKDHVGVVELVGPIVDGTTFQHQLRELTKRDDLKAIVIRIDSPGGAVAPSQEIFQAIRRASKTKPIVASMGSVAASGGFWSALGADWIFASPGSITGSIGVITQTPDLRGLADLARVKVHTFKSGPLKDVGNPLREMTEEDKALFMSLIHDIYQQFIEVVAERRKLDIEKVRELADGRVMTGHAAHEAGLVDELGGLEDAAKKAVLFADRRSAEKAGKPPPGTEITEETEVPTLVYPKKPLPGLLKLLTEGASSAVSTGIERGVLRAAKTAESELEPRSNVELR